MSTDNNKIKLITRFISILSFFLFVPTAQNLFGDFPLSIWDKNPRQLALELAASCQSPDNAAQYKVSIDKSNPNNPPDRCTISVYSMCRKCDNFTGSVSILHCQPEKSYFAGVHGEAPSWNGEYKPHLNTHLEMRVIAIPYEKARHIARVIWWLNQVKSIEVYSSNRYSGVFSSSDQSGGVCFNTLDRYGKISHQFKYTGTVWGRMTSESIPQRWDMNFDDEEILNLSHILFDNSLPKLLKNEWQSADVLDEFFYWKMGSKRLLPREKWPNMKPLVETFTFFLDNNPIHGSPGEIIQLSFVVTLISKMAMEDFRPHLVRLQKKLDAMSYRNQGSMDALNTEIQVLEAQYAAADCHEKNKLHEKIDALNNELLLKQLGMERGAALDKLKMSLSFALDKR
jgi:hypothetical protein